MNIAILIPVHCVLEYRVYSCTLCCDVALLVGMATNLRCQVYFWPFLTGPVMVPRYCNTGIEINIVAVYTIHLHGRVLDAQVYYLVACYSSRACYSSPRVQVYTCNQDRMGNGYTVYTRESTPKNMGKCAR